MSEAVTKPGEPAAPNVTEYLAGPKKKRRSYVVAALNNDFDPEILTAIQNHIKNQYPQQTFVNPKTEAELQRQFSRHITLLITHDSFVGSFGKLFGLLQSLKQKKIDTLVPVLFLTENPKELIETYHKNLLPFQEADDYVAFRDSPMAQLFNRIRSALEIGVKRRSRRYRCDVPVTFFNLGSEVQHNGKILDISIHGALLKSDSDIIFKPKDQVRISIQLTRNFYQEGQGDFLHISARVRRIFISGSMVGLSFEHVSEKQLLSLTRFVTSIANSVMLKRTTPKPRDSQRAPAPKAAKKGS